MQPGDSRWNLTIRLPRTYQKLFRLYVAEHDTDLQTIGEEMVNEWAKKRGITLPKARESKPEPESDRQTLHVSSAL